MVIDGCLVVLDALDALDAQASAQPETSYTLL